jgi:cysteine desulfurase family protein
MVYFDNAATTFPKPEEVYTFMDRFYRECGVNVGRGQHKLAAKALALVAETRQLILELNHCINKRVVFTHTATEALNIILRGIELHNGSNVYVSPFEHNAVMRVLHYISSSRRLNIFTLAINKKNFSYDIDGIKRQFINNRPNLVVINHASNVCGVMAPIAEICAFSKKFGAVNVIDMCQTMGLIDTNLSSSDIDYAVFAGHKTLYAPFGIAGFICADAIELQPLIYGGTGVDSANRNLPETVPERYEAGSPNILAIAGLNAALKWLNSVGLKHVLETEKHNHIHLLQLLNSFDNIKIVAPVDVDKSVGIVSCLFEGYSSDSIGQVLSEKDIAVRTGLHCAPDAHRFLSTFPGGTVRFSVSIFNNERDFSRLHDALKYIYENS